MTSHGVTHEFSSGDVSRSTRVVRRAKGHEVGRVTETEPEGSESRVREVASIGTRDEPKEEVI